MGTITLDLLFIIDWGSRGDELLREKDCNNDEKYIQHKFCI